MPTKTDNVMRIYIWLYIYMVTFGYIMNKVVKKALVITCKNASERFSKGTYVDKEVKELWLSNHMLPYL